MKNKKNKIKQLISLIIIIAVLGTILPQLTISALSSEISVLGVDDAEFAGGDGTEENPYLVATPDHLNNVRNHLDCHFRQIADIDMSSVSNWKPIGNGTSLYGATMMHELPDLPYDPFLGSFDGNNYRIYNLTIKDSNISYGSDVYGLFSALGACTVENVNLVGVNYSINKKSTDYEGLWTEYGAQYGVYTGGIAGICTNESVVNNCSCSGSISVVHCSYAFVGGILGRGRATKCNNSTDINVNADSSSRDECDSTVWCGGIVGHPHTVNGVLSECLNQGNIVVVAGNGLHIGGISGEDGKINNCMNTGNIEGHTIHNSTFPGAGGNCNCGGIVGKTSSDYTKNCVNYGNVYASIDKRFTSTTPTSYAGGVVGWCGYYGSGRVFNCVNNSKNITSKQRDLDNQIVDGTAGRIAGYSISIKECYSSDTTTVNSSLVSGNSADSNGEGVNKSTLLTQAPYKEFDFNNIWSFDSQIGGAVLSHYYSDGSQANNLTTVWNDHTYQLYEVGMTWAEAKAFCEEKGGHLVTITSQEEQRFIEELINRGNKNQYLLGATDEEKEGTWRWVTGEKWDYSNWDKNMPDNGEGRQEDYLQIYRINNHYVNGSQAFKWNDITIDNYYSPQPDLFRTEHIGLICEWDSIVDTDPGASVPIEKDIEISYESIKIKAHFSEKFFEKSAYEYNHALAQLTLGVVLSGFSKDQDARWGETSADAAKDRRSNIEEAYKQMGFIIPANYFHYDIKLNETKDKVAYSIAKRPLSTGETLIAVVVRGGGYGGEWSSNFNVGTGEQFHDGFNKAAQEVYGSAVEAIQATNGKVKLWITGYSRGAAVANLFSAKIDDYAQSSNKVSPDGIFAYTFATPQGVTKRGNASAKLYKNIFNIINPGDPVAEVAMTKWGFTRYGVTKEFDRKIVKQYQSVINQQYQANFHGEGDFDVETNLKQETTIAAFMKILCGEFPTTKSSIKIQKVLQELEEFNNLRKNIGDKENLQKAEWAPISIPEYYIELYEKYEKGFVCAYSNASNYLESNIIGKKIKEKVDSNSLANITLILTLCELHGLKSSRVADIIINIIKSNLASVYFKWKVLGYFESIGEIKQGHFPETYLAWMTQSESIVFGKESSKKHFWNISIHCPVDIKVYDNSDILVADIKDHDIISSDIPVIIDGESTEFILNEAPGTYRIEITPTENGKMTYTVTELDENEAVERRINYVDISISPGEAYIGNINTENNYYSGKYDLSCVKGGSISSVYASEVLVDNYDVTLQVVISGNGDVIGEGDYIKGDTAVLRAYPDEGNTFVGWYANNRLLSKETVYKNQMLDDAEVKAIFEKRVDEMHTWKETDAVDIPGIDDIVAIRYTCQNCGLTKTEIQEKASEPCSGDINCPGKVFLDMPARGTWAHDPIDWAVVKGVTNGTDSTHFSPNSTCTRAQVVTFLWRANGCPEPQGKGNPFTDVKPDAYYYKAVLWAVEQGITTGTSTSTFSPNSGCTRGQVVTFLWRASEKPEPSNSFNPFGDVGPDEYYSKAVLWAVEKEITNGTSANKFSPNSTCTRAQIVTFLYRAMA